MEGKLCSVPKVQKALNSVNPFCGFFRLPKRPKFFTMLLNKFTGKQITKALRGPENEVSAPCCIWNTGCVTICYHIDSKTLRDCTQGTTELTV